MTPSGAGRPGRSLVAVVALVRCPAAASAHAYLIKTSRRRAASSTPRPRTSRSPSTRRSSRASRSSRSPTRTPTRRRPRPVQPLAGEPRHARRPAPAAPARGLVPRLLAGDLGRRPSGAGRVHVRGRAEPGPGAAVRDPAHRADGDDDAAPGRPLGRVPDGDDRDRAVRRCGSRSRGRVVRRVQGASLRAGHGRLRRRLGARAARDPGLPRGVDGDRLAALVLRRRRARAALPDDRVRARLRRPGDLLRALLRRGLDRALGRPARARAPLDRRDPRRPRAPLAAAAAVLVDPGACRPRRRRPRRAALSLAARLAPPRLRLALARRPRRAARPLGEPAGGRRVAGLAVVRAALLERRVRLGRSSCSRSGIWATVLHLPILAALWQTSYGQAILVKAGAARRRDAARRRQPRSAPSRGSPPRREPPGARRAGRVAPAARSSRARPLLVVAAVFAAAVLSSLAPPAKRLARGGLGARAGRARARSPPSCTRTGTR